MFTRLLDPTNDFAFKKVFGSEKHKDVLIAFLNDVLEFRNQAPIEDVEFLNPSHEPDLFMHKPSVLDILCKDTRGHHYIVEMQSRINTVLINVRFIMGQKPIRNRLLKILIITILNLLSLSPFVILFCFQINLIFNLITQLWITKPTQMI